MTSPVQPVIVRPRLARGRVRQCCMRLKEDLQGVAGASGARRWQGVGLALGVWLCQASETGWHSGMFFRRARHTNDNSQEYSGPSIIAHDLTVDGNVTLSGELHVDGTINGTVQAGCCVIEANGVISGSVEADEVHVYGQVFGPVTARHVHVYPGGRVEGDIYNETVSIESGAFIQGAIHHTDPSQWMAEEPTAEPEPLPAMPFESSAREAVNAFAAAGRREESPLRRSMEMQANPLGNIQPIRVVRPR